MNINKKNKQTYKSPEKIKRLNDAGLLPSASLYNSSMLRDQNFALCQKRMFDVNKTFKISFRVGLALQLLTLYFSIVLFFQNIVRVLTTAAASEFLSTVYDEIERVNVNFETSGWICVTPFAILGTIMTIFANKYMDNKFTSWLYVSYAAFGIIGILSFFSLWDDMNYSENLNVIMGSVLCVDSVVGLLLCNHTYDAVKEIEELVTQEGFPSFDSAMFYMHSSKYVKYRERWEKKHKTIDDYSKVERKCDEMIVTPPTSPDKMDGVCVSTDDIEKNFNEMESVTVNDNNEMEELDVNMNFNENDYTYQTNDPKKKYL